MARDDFYWIRRNIIDGMSTRRLAKALGIPHPAAYGHLMMAVARFGEPSKRHFVVAKSESWLIEQGAEWKGAEGALVNAMLRFSFLVETEQGYELGSFAGHSLSDTVYTRRKRVENSKRRRICRRTLIAQALCPDGNYTCRYCDVSLELSQIEIDHIIPVARGGTNDIGNLAISCAPCNRRKYDKLNWTRKVAA